MARYDLILQGGHHRLGVTNPDDFHATVVHQLRLSFPYRLPYLGTLLRNFWAKRHGARLF